MATRRLSLANLLTLSRLAAVPLLLIAAARGSTPAAVFLLAYALLTDVVDGPVARASGQASQLGARLDSRADCALYLAAPVAAALLHPEVWREEPLTLASLALGYGVPISVGLRKYRRLIAYHTRASKFAGVLFGAAGLWFLLTGVFWPLRIAAMAVVAAGAEEAAMTWLLPEWRADVRGLGAAMTMRHVPRRT